LPIGKALAAWIRSLSPNGAPPDIEAVRTAAFLDISADLLTNTEKLLAGSLLLGMDHANPATALADSDYSPLPFDEAIKFLKARVSLTKAEWAALEPKLAFRAFTMAKLTQCDYIEAVRGRLVNALEKGEGFEQLWGDVKAIAEADGSTIKPGYWETVYRTNVQTAYNAGRRMQFDRDPPSALALMVLEDERTSSICRPLAGLVLPYNHPFWEDHWPPFHFNCRTTVRGVYDYEVGRVPVQNVPMKRLRKEFHPQSGFGENPLAVDSFWMYTPSMMERAERYGIANDFYNLYLNLFSPTGKLEKGITFSSVAYKPLRERLVTAFQTVPASIKKQIEQIQNQVGVVPSIKLGEGDRVVSFYNHQKRAVFLRTGVDAGVIRHEYGHALDSVSVNNKDFDNAVVNDAYRYYNRIDGVSNLGKQVSNDPSWYDIPAISDTFSALTKNMIVGKYGHPTAYWNQGFLWQKFEIVANAHDLWGAGDKQLIQKYHEYFPYLAAFFDKLFE
jgi:SPP1 gp7 family putative phage head morphogenesis protein